MPILASNSAKPRELIPAGNYLARCFQQIELGTITEMYMGEPKTQKKVRIGWELPGELKTFNDDKGPQPLVISKEFTLSMHEKSNLRKMLASWRGKDFSIDEAAKFDITALLGVPCMLNIIHTPGKTDPSVIYQTIAGVSPIPKGVKVPDQMNKTFVLSYDDFDEDLFATLPDFIKDKMKTSDEYRELYNPKRKNEVQVQHDFLDDGSDLPF